MGRHLWDISIAQILDSWLPPVSPPNLTSNGAHQTHANSIQIVYAIVPLTPWTLLFLKTTFFLLYLHLFSRIRWVRISSWTGICFVVLSNGAAGIYAFVIANPHENASWAGKATRIGIPVAILSLVEDVVIFIIPFVGDHTASDQSCKENGCPLDLPDRWKVSRLLCVMIRAYVLRTTCSAIICSILNIYYRCQLQHSTDTM